MLLCSSALKWYFKDLRYADALLHMGIHPLEQQIHFYQVDVFYYSKVCLEYFEIIYQSTLIFRVP